MFQFTQQAILRLLSRWRRHFIRNLSNVSPFASLSREAEKPKISVRDLKFIRNYQLEVTNRQVFAWGVIFDRKVFDWPRTTESAIHFHLSQISKVFLLIIFGLTYSIKASTVKLLLVQDVGIWRKQISSFLFCRNLDTPKNPKSAHIIDISRTLTFRFIFW